MSARVLAPGVHRIDAAVYHADRLREVPTLSSTLARRIINQSPRHAWTEHPRLNPDWQPVESRVFDVGRAAHRAVLGHGDDYVPIPEDMLDARGGATTKAAREFVADARAAGKTPLKPADWAAVEAMATAVQERLAEMRITIDPARCELTALAEIDGVWCRAMVDYAPTSPKAPLYDLKTTEDASPEAVIRTIARYGYDMQAAWYLDTWRAATGEDRRFRFIFVEKKPPHEIAVVELDADGGETDWMDDARAKCREARRIWRECLEADEWPGYPRQVLIVGAPAWYRQAWAERALGEPVIAGKPRDPQPQFSSRALQLAWEMQRPPQEGGAL